VICKSALAWVSAIVCTLTYGHARADWLASQIQLNGSYSTSSDLATPTQATAEAVRTLRIIGRGAEVAAGDAYLTAEAYHGTEYLSRKIISGVGAGALDASLVPELLTHQNSDGGFGEFAGYDSDPLDTAFALDALAASGNTAVSPAALGVNYLLQHQNADGSWFDSGGAPGLNVTALTARSLYAFNGQNSAIAAATANGGIFLISQRSSTGLWSEDHLTAQALLTLATISSDLASIQQSATALAAARRADGSWSDDVYSTALALRALAAANASLAATTSTTGGSIAGYVISAQTNEPLAKVTVMLSGSGLTVNTNTAGYFSIPGVTPGNFTVVASLSGYGVASTVAAVHAGQPTTVGPIILAQSSAAAVVRGSVFDASTQLPLAGVAISLSGTAAYAATSAADGSFELDGITPGAYTVGFQGSGYNNVTGTLTAPAGSVTAVRQGLTLVGANLDATPGTLSGQIIDATTSRAIAGAALTLSGGGSATSGADGSFSFTSVPRGNYQIQTSATGYAARSYSFVFAAGQNGGLGALPLYPATGATAPTTLTVSGTVVDGIDNHALAGASVAVAGGQTLTTDATGSFTLSGLTSLSFSLSISATGYQTGGFSGTASGFGQVAGTFPLTPAGTGNGATTSTLKGTVTNAVSNQPIAGALITAAGTSLSATSSTSGTFEIDNIAPLTLALTASAAQYTARSYSVNLTQAGTYSINVQLTPAAGAGTNQFQILNFAAVEGSSGANTLQHFAATIINLQAAAQTPIILADVLDATGTVVATVSPYAPGTTTTAPVPFAANQTINLVIPWNTAHFAPGSYRLALRVVQPGTITRDLPTGVVLTNAQADTTISPTSSISGQTSFNPPLSQAGTSVPVTLAALIINTGNVPLTGAGFTLTIKDTSGNTLVSQPASTVMIPVGNHATVSFGSWVPTKTGNLPVTVSAGDPSIQGTITGSLYVGDEPRGTFIVTPTQVLTGTQTVHATVGVTGVDTTIGVSSPLVYAIRNAALLGSQYVAVNVVNDQVSSRCLRCHVQSQSYFGLASLLGHDVGSDQSATRMVYNAMATGQQDNGVLSDNYPPAPVTETSLALWGLTQGTDKLTSFATMYKAANLLQSDAVSANGHAYWNADYTSNGGWWVSADATTMTVVKGLVDLLLTAQNNNVTGLTDYAPGNPVANVGSNADALRLGPDRALYTILGNAGTVVRYDPTSGASTAVAAGLPVPCYNVRVVSPTEFYVVCPQQLIHVLPDGTHTVIASLGPDAGDLQIAPNGTLFILDADGNQILTGPPGGPFTPYVSGGLLNLPRSIEFAPDGSLYVANYGSYNILKVGTDKSVSVFADGLSYQPIYLAVQTDGSLFAPHVSTYKNSQTTPDGLMYIDANGVAKRLFSVNGLRGVAFANGQLNMVALDGSLRQLIVGTLNTGQLGNLSSLVTSAANGFLDRYGDGNSDNLVQASRLIGLSEARRYVTDSGLRSVIDQATAAINTLLRSRQNSDGGWGRYPGYGSDALVTALVGTGLDYVPPANDTVVINTVQYLLNNQASDGSWTSADGILATRFASTSLVMAYLPRVLDRLGGLSVELHVNLPPNITLMNASLAPSGDLPLTGGGSAYTWQLPGVTSQGRTVTFDLSMASLVPGENRPAASAAYMLSSNSFDNSQIQVNLAIPTVHASDGLSLQSVTTDSSSYPANSPVQIAATVSNVAPANASGSVDVLIETGAGTVVTDLGTTAFPAISSGTSVALPSTWNTGALLAGGYQVDVRLYNAAGTLVDERITAFSIVTPTAVVTATVTADKTSYQAWDTATLNTRVANVSANAIVAASTATLTVQTPSGATLYTTNFSVTPLTPGALRDLVASVHLSDAATGDYPVQVVINDTFSGAVVATASGTFHVNRVALQALAGKVAVQNSSVYQGTSNLCTETVTNLSSAALPGVTLTQSVVSLTTQAVIQTGTQAVGFTPQQQQVFLNSVTTNALPLGAYACVLSATYNGSTRQIGAAGFQVLQPPISIKASLGIGARGRLLVLIDNEDHDSPCGQIHDLELWAPFHTPLPDDARIDVELRDGAGNRVDFESVTLKDYRGAIDRSVGKGADLSITAVSRDVLTVEIRGGTALQTGYRVIATASSASLPPIIADSGPMGSASGWPLDVGTRFGDFASSDVHPTGENHPSAHEQKGPSPAAQRAFLDGFLKTAGWSYQIVTTDEDFEHEMRSGAYNEYAIFAQRQKLDEHTRKELREAVFRGEGLVYAVADAREGDEEFTDDLDAALGIKRYGETADASGLVLVASNLGVTGTAPFSFNEDVERVKLNGAQAAGEFQEARSTQDIAVTTYTYGLGHSVYGDYPLLAEATQAGSTSLHATLLEKTLEYAQPSFSQPHVSEVVPAHIALTNQGVATAGRVELPLPTGVTVVDPGSAQFSTNTLTWNFDLALAQQLGFDAWLRLPSAPGAVAFNALIQTGTPGNYVDYTHVTLTLNALGSAALADARAFAATDRAFEDVQHQLDMAQFWLDRGRRDYAALSLLAATDELIESSKPQAMALRLMVDQVIWSLSRTL
jgi:hypothetical protein